MSKPKFKELKEQPAIRAICSSCNKPTGKKGSMTAWIFAYNNCNCSISQTTAPGNAATAPANQSFENNPNMPQHRVAETIKPNVYIDDRYEVLEQIGQGGMGIVYKVKDTKLDKILAIKTLHADLAADKFARKRFEQEAKAAINLTHANLVAVYGHGITPNDAPYLIMDYIDGEDLAQLLEREVYLSVPQTLDIVSQICEALIHAHLKGIVHRDLKPSNIILTKSEEGNDIVKIVDFGIAKILPTINEQTNNLTQTGELFGSPLYMSPEQCKGEPIDARSDIYSLGCIIYELLTGKAAFASDNPIKIILRHLTEEPAVILELEPASSNALSGIIRHCLEKDPQYRYESVQELYSDLMAFQSGQIPVTTVTSGMFIYAKRMGAAAIDAAIVAAGCSLSVCILLGSGFVGLQNPHAIGNVVLTFTLLFQALILDNLFLGWTYLYGLAIWVAFFVCHRNQSESHGAVTLAWIVIPLVIIVFNWLYHAILESSSLQGTFGKKLLGLKVLNEQKRSISFLQATTRHFSKVLFPFSVPYLLIPSLMPPLSTIRRRLYEAIQRTPHDRISKCFVTSTTKVRVKRIDSRYKENKLIRHEVD